MTRIRQPLRSTALASFEYDDETQTLEITFVNGQSYTYEAVPPDIPAALATASSPGRFYNTFIKDAF